MPSMHLFANTHKGTHTHTPTHSSASSCTSKTAGWSENSDRHNTILVCCEMRGFGCHSSRNIYTHCNICHNHNLIVLNCMKRWGWLIKINVVLFPFEYIMWPDVGADVCKSLVFAISGDVQIEERWFILIALVVNLCWCWKQFFN